MLAIRLRRTGSKKRPYFRVVVTDSRTARDSSFVEVLGSYNPRTNPEKLEINRERLAHWLKSGARPSDTAGGAGSRGGAARVVSRARDVVEVVARALADRPDAVRVTERTARGSTLVELFMAPGDLGRVIGRQGRTAAAMRTLVSAAADLEGGKATLEFRDDAGPR
jgi:ribosomal protein S16